MIRAPGLPATINLVVALQCEATPLIDRFRLRGRNRRQGRDLSSDCAFRVYGNEDAGLRLVVSGVGRISAAAATSWLHALDGGSGACGWLNVGIAGHADREPGAGARVHKIIDQATGACWYPPRISRNADTLCMTTVDRVMKHYDEDMLYDMEGAAFYATAARFASCELTHCYKVVSDNRLQPAERISRTMVRTLIEGQIQAIEALLDEIRALAGDPAPTRQVDAVCAHLAGYSHFSVSELHRLRRLIQRWLALHPEEGLRDEVVAAVASGHGLLEYLERRIMATTPCFD